MSIRTDHRRIYSQPLRRTRLKVEVLERRCVLSAHFGNVWQASIEQKTVAPAEQCALSEPNLTVTSASATNIASPLVYFESCDCSSDDSPKTCHLSHDSATSTDPPGGNHGGFATADLVYFYYALTGDLSVTPTAGNSATTSSENVKLLGNLLYQKTTGPVASRPINFFMSQENPSDDMATQPASPATAPFAEVASERLTGATAMSPTLVRPTAQGVFLDIGTTRSASIAKVTANNSTVSYFPWEPSNGHVSQSTVVSPVIQSEPYFDKKGSSVQVSLQGEVTRNHYSAFILGREETTSVRARSAMSPTKALSPLRVRPTIIALPISATAVQTTTDIVNHNFNSSSTPRLEAVEEEPTPERPTHGTLFVPELRQKGIRQKGIRQNMQDDPKASGLFHWRPLWDRLVVLGAGSCIMFSAPRAADRRRKVEP
ncbi:MAG: hypothetical protein O3C60_11860 [Planctomycetota bacterium]|nr:hypothetical protein [Planctomycetota bacterium]